MKIPSILTIATLRCAALLTALAAGSLDAQQVADPNFKPSVEKPLYSGTNAPVVRVDEGHHNFYTIDGRYKPFAELLRLDGCVVQPSKTWFTNESLAGTKILVIAGALSAPVGSEAGQGGAAFADAEISVVRDWVSNGGSLLLITGPPPFSATAGRLALAFGVRFTNVLARLESADDGFMNFERFNGSLADHPITVGQAGPDRVDKVAAFGGSALQIDKDGEPLLILPPETVCYAQSAGFGGGTGGFPPHSSSRTVLNGWLQGGVRRFGKGRVAAFAEAGLFSAQLDGPDKEPLGMNTSSGRQNPQFVLNVIHWLAGSLDQ